VSLWLFSHWTASSLTLSQSTNKPGLGAAANCYIQTWLYIYIPHIYLLAPIFALSQFRHWDIFSPSAGTGWICLSFGIMPKWGPSAGAGCPVWERGV
jgi:hypothetical protein